MTVTGLFDGSFSQAQSATLGGDNCQERPKRGEWQRGVCGAYSTFYTDQCLQQARDAWGVKVAWLLEPPSLSDTHYRVAVEMENVFDYILTFDARYLERGEKWLYYPLGGSWIDPRDWGIRRKTRMVSVIGTEKQRAPGHQMRHEVIKRFGEKADVWGRGYKPVSSKYEALSPYRYSIVVESIRLDDYFSEKLIDALCLGTIPIYWGSPTIADHFDMDGIIPFRDIDELDNILQSISWEDYKGRVGAIEHNWMEARKYRCAEDWIHLHYPFLFG